MKKSLFILALVFSQLSLAQKWNYNFEEAKKTASEENKNIIMIFSGSDWCAPCIRLEKKIWNSPEFIEISNEKWILLKLNFPRKKANQLSEEQTVHNRNLAEIYNKEGSFPLVVVMNPEGKVLGKMGFKNITPNEYIKMIEATEK